jgi:sirohydrochlorin ferrochelatase
VILALVDNGSLEPAAHLNLRRVAAEISARAGVTVHPVSWRHSHHVPAEQLQGIPALVLADWVTREFDRGERDFLFIPFFISGQGAIGSALRSDLESLRTRLGGFEFRFADGLGARDALVPIIIARIRETITGQRLSRPIAVIADHGGPSTASAELRDDIARRVSALLAAEVSRVLPASLEGAAYPHNSPLLNELLGARGLDRGDVVIAPLFLTPGRHAGPAGDIASAVAEARQRAPGLRCHVAGLVGTHPSVSDVLAEALRDALAARP